VLEKSYPFQELKKERSSILIDNVDNSSKALIINFILKNTKKDILIISGGVREKILIDNLSTFTKDILEFPSLETTPCNEDIPENVGKRFYILKKIIDKKNPKILISSLSSLLQKTFNKKNIKNFFFILKKGQSLSFSNLEKRILDLGYKKNSLVVEKGHFAIRGGIIDLFSTTEPFPYRIEFFSNTIDNIRIFDIGTQQTIKKVDTATISTAKEIEKTSFLLDYLNDFIIIFDNLLDIEDLYVKIKNNKNNLDEFLKKIKKNQTIFISTIPIEKLSPIKLLSSKGNYFKKISFSLFQKDFITKKWIHPISFFPSDDPFETLKYLQNINIKILFFTENNDEKNFILKYLKEKNLFLKNVLFKKGYLSSGFIISDLSIAFFPYTEFNPRKKIKSTRTATFYQPSLSEFQKIEKGDIVVHFHCGIGKYLGIEKKQNNLGKQEEFLTIEYANNSKLFIPLSQSYLISKYIGTKEEKPILNILGSTKWQKTKEKALKNIVGYAKELLNLYAMRTLDRGFIYPKDSEEQKIFENLFEYDETTDQIKAIEEIKEDMYQKKPIERLVCGDVGYGKTEVAMRAVFKAVYDGKKQVAILVPTTILAIQHFETFSERMKEFPIIIEKISRFNNPSKNKEILQKTKEGKIDILIGTHRILSKDIFFKNLGLIIIDEEQRFGVKAKEHLKVLKKNVDSLSLSATPIPRTLYMSLIKVRDISTINTPPQDRLPIKTIICENDDKIIKDAIIREITREGQIFFVHNKIESIYKRKEELQRLLPNIKILLVHGRMKSKEIDLIFHSFKKGKADLLITTTIIENGIDIFNCNTILIDNADKFGLSDLYQLRGRVGRWNKTAYCYLLIPKNKKVSEISQKRLSSLIESSSLGSGIKIAMKDLEIRGSGDILGEQQSGHISEIGFNLYLKLLKKAIDHLKDNKPVNLIETKLEFTLPAFIPNDYISDGEIRFEIYHRLGNALSSKDIDEIEKELKDRFGNIPKEVSYLLSLSKIKLHASSYKIISLKLKKMTLHIQKDKKYPETIIPLPYKIQENPQKLKEYIIKNI